MRKKELIILCTFLLNLIFSNQLIYAAGIHLRHIVSKTFYDAPPWDLRWAVFYYILTGYIWVVWVMFIKKVGGEKNGVIG